MRITTASHPLISRARARYFRDAALCARRAAVHWEWGFMRRSLSHAFAAGLLALFAWFGRREDRVMFCFSITCLSWPLQTRSVSGSSWSGSPRSVLCWGVYTTYGSCARSHPLPAERRHEIASTEGALWVFLLIEVAHPLWMDMTNVLVRVGWDSANAVLLVAGGILVLCAADRPLRWGYKLEIAALWLMAAFMIYEAARYIGWAPIESVVLRHSHARHAVRDRRCDLEGVR